MMPYFSMRFKAHVQRKSCIKSSVMKNERFFWTKKFVEIIDASILYQIYDIRNNFLEIITKRDRKFLGCAMRTITNMYLIYL